MTEDDLDLETAKTTTAGDPAPPEPAPAEPEPDDDPGFDEDDEDGEDETFEAVRRGKVVPLRDANGNVYPAARKPPPLPRSQAYVLPERTKGDGPRYAFPSAGNEPRQGPTAVRKLKREKAAADAMQLYYEVLTDPKATAYLRMMAADRLLDRIEGKPVSRTAPKGKVETVDEMRELDPKLMTEAERDQIRALCERQIASRRPK